MPTPAPVAADLRFGRRPSLMMALAREPAGWGTAGRHLGRGPEELTACNVLSLCTSCLPPLVPPHGGALSHQLSADLIRADTLGVLGWTDMAVAGVCRCVCVCRS